MKRMVTVDAILMASGSSERYGRKNKLLEQFRGLAMAEHTLKLACEAGVFGKVFFIAADPAVAVLAQGYPARVLRNEHPGRGARESIRLGAEASRADACLFFACDQPLLDIQTVARILEQAGTGKIVLPVWRGQRGGPVLFPRAFRDELRALGEGESGRAVMARHPDQLLEVEASGPGAMADVDTPGDFHLLGTY